VSTAIVIGVAAVVTVIGVRFSEIVIVSVASDTEGSLVTSVTVIGVD
jgi:hypothetical protein